MICSEWDISKKDNFAVSGGANHFCDHFIFPNAVGNVAHLECSFCLTKDSSVTPQSMKLTNFKVPLNPGGSNMKTDLATAYFSHSKGYLYA